MCLGKPAGGIRIETYTRAFSIVLTCLYVCACAGMIKGNPDQKQTAPPAKDGTSITGKVTIKGSGPRSFAALTTAQGVIYRITGPLVDTLSRQYQNRKVRLRGTVTGAALGPGRPAAFRAEKILPGEEQSKGNGT
jgi:hypothetical protein